MQTADTVAVDEYVALLNLGKHILQFLIHRKTFIKTLECT